MPLRNRWLCIPTLQGGESQSRVGELWGLVVFIVLPDCLPGSAPIWFGLTADCQSQRVGGLPVFLLIVRATLPFLKKLLPDNPLPSIAYPLERKGCTALNELRGWLSVRSRNQVRVASRLLFQKCGPVLRQFPVTPCHPQAHRSAPSFRPI